MKGFLEMKKWTWILAILPSLALLIILFNIGNASVQQPIKYNHKKHIEAGLDCVDCHTHVRDGARATIPTLGDCMECHEDPQSDSKEEEILRTLAANGIHYPWKQVAKMPEDVLFSHRRHVALAEIECQECHGMIQELEEPPKKTAIKLTMKFCMNCHEEKAADNDCIACHR